MAGDPAGQGARRGRAGRVKAMTVLAIFKYQIKPGRLPDFMKKLAEAADPKFASPVMPKSVRVLRATVPGPDTNVSVMLEYEDMAAYGARTAFEQANPDWGRLFDPAANAPETLVSVELLTEVPPEAGEETERVPFGFRPS
jgi:NIPSNAP